MTWRERPIISKNSKFDHIFYHSCFQFQVQAPGGLNNSLSTPVVTPSILPKSTSTPTAAAPPTTNNSSVVNNNGSSDNGGSSVALPDGSMLTPAAPKAEPAEAAEVKPAPLPPVVSHQPKVFKVDEGRPDVSDMLKNEQIDLIVNTTEGRRAIADSALIRRLALANKVCYTTTLAGGEALAIAIAHGQGEKVRRLQTVHAELQNTA